MNNKKIYGRVHSKLRKVLFLFVLIALAILSMIFLWQSIRLKEVKKDELIKRILINEKNKYDEENYNQNAKQNQNQLKKLKKKYPDMIGWVEIKGTDFSYPVMQSGISGHHEDNPEFYLDRNVNGEMSVTGTPFLDSRCNMDSDELIIYGHNMDGKKHFGYLQSYREEEFYKKHKVISFTKVGGVEEKYDILSVLVTDIKSDCYKNTDVYNDEEYKFLIEEIINNSLYRCDAVDKVRKDMDKFSVEEFFHRYQLITLSTCRTGEGRDARLLVIGVKKVKEYERNDEKYDFKVKE